MTKARVLVPPFADRAEAGRMLAESLAEHAGHDDLLILGLPRGGVPVAFEVAAGLGAPLDVFLVRKLGAPGHEELAMGAIASGNVVVLNEEVLRALTISDDDIGRTIERERDELARREAVYREGRPAIDVRGRRLVLVDDGMATGSTMRAAVKALRTQGPERIIVAVPVGAAASRDDLLASTDDVVLLAAPEPFRAVGLWYENFQQIGDDEVRELLARASSMRPRRGGADHEHEREHESERGRPD